MTSNPSKVSEVASQGVEILEQITLSVGRNKFNREYLSTKEVKFRHSYLAMSGRFFFSVTGITSAEEVRDLGKFMQGKMYNPLLRIVMGISADKNKLENPLELKKISEIFRVTQLYDNFVPILHYSFRASKQPLSDLWRIKELIPYVVYIQLNDLLKDEIKVLKYAVEHFRVDFPLDSKNFHLVNNPSFVELISNEAFVILDNSKGTGRRENVKNYKEKIDQCLNVGINRIALAGGFGPDSLDTYFSLKDYYKLNFSVDAESKLKSGHNLDLQKARDYLNQLIN